MIKELIPPLIGKALGVSSFLFPNWTSSIAIKMFASPRRGGLRPKDKQFLDSCYKTDTFLTELGSTPYYLWNESGTKTLLLLHGWESNSARWRYLISYFKELDYRIVSIDAPGHGASGSKTFDFNQYAQVINYAVGMFEVNSIITHSVGGLAMSFYLNQYDYTNFDNFVLLGAPYRLRVALDNYYALLKPSFRVRNFLEQAFVEKFDYKIDDVSAPILLDGVSIPALIIHDKQDTSVKIESAKKYNQSFLNSTLMITEGFGHGLQNKKVFASIKEFIESNSNNQ